MEPSRKTLVIRSGAIGDFIVTLPVIQLLRTTYPFWPLSLIAKDRVRSLVKDVVDEFVHIDGPFLVPFFQKEVDRNSEGFRYLADFDFVISYLGRTGKVSANLSALPNTRVINATAIPPVGYDHHVTEFLLEPLAEVVDISSAPLPTITIGEREAKLAGEFLSSCGLPADSRLIAVHPGSGSSRKVIPPSILSQVVNRIVLTFPGVRLLVIEGEADARHVSSFNHCLEGPYVKIRRENLSEVAAILSKASLFVGNDSGISHLAAAVGVPTIAVFRSTNPSVWAPRGKSVRIATDESLPLITEQAAFEVFGGGTGEAVAPSG
jgi:ADP-heptose:LPS heptosyltransferase